MSPICVMFYHDCSKISFIANLKNVNSINLELIFWGIQLTRMVLILMLRRFQLFKNGLYLRVSLMFKSF